MKKIIVLLFLGFIGQLQAQKSFGFGFANTPEKIVIIKVFEIGPAQKAGVKVDDIWLKINNIVLLGKTNQEIGNILGQLQRDEASFEFSRNGKIVNLKFSRIERDLFLPRCLSGDCNNGKGIYRLENGETIEGEFKNGKYIDPNKPQFATSHLQPNYIADQIDTSSLEGKDAVRSQNGYQAYVDLRFEAMTLTLGLSKTKEVNPEKALALCNEAIRIFPNLHRAYIDRGQANYKLGNKIAAQNDFDRARQLTPEEPKWIDKAIADVEGRVWVDPDRVTKTYEYSAPTVLYNSTNSESQQEELKKQNAQTQRTAKCVCCLGTSQQEIKGMYLGSKTYSVTPVNGLGISHNETVSQYGPSTFVSCRCCH
jgi:tetratricopeptide (TPR) repeat protein